LSSGFDDADICTRPTVNFEALCIAEAYTTSSAAPSLECLWSSPTGVIKLPVSPKLSLA
jgi:hypothetical protein